MLSVKTRLRKPSNIHRLLVLRFRLQRRATASRSQDAVRFTTNHSSHIAVRDQTPVTMPPTAIYLQKACLQHRYIRTRDNSHIVERPERLRAVNVGLAASIARLEERAQPVSVSVGKSSSATAAESKVEEDSDALTEALGKLQLSTPSRTETLAHVPVTFVHSSASVDILNDAAVKFVHGDIERDVYLENLRKWAHESQDKVARGESEIPEGYAQGDLYCECDRNTPSLSLPALTRVLVCPGSLDAIQGALGTVCEAVDAILEGSGATTSGERGAPSQAFVAIRPPGHHCGEVRQQCIKDSLSANILQDTPSGFCFVNNVAVGAVHAHLKHNVNRVVILDIDLHHGIHLFRSDQP